MDTQVQDGAFQGSRQFRGLNAIALSSTVEPDHALAWLTVRTPLHCSLGSSKYATGSLGGFGDNGDGSRGLATGCCCVAVSSQKGVDALLRRLREGPGNVEIVRERPRRNEDAPRPSRRAYLFMFCAGKVGQCVIGMMNCRNDHSRVLWVRHKVLGQASSLGRSTGRRPILIGVSEPTAPHDQVARFDGSRETYRWPSVLMRSTAPATPRHLSRARSAASAAASRSAPATPDPSGSVRAARLVRSTWQLWLTAKLAAATWCKDVALMPGDHVACSADLQAR